MSVCERCKSENLAVSVETTGYICNDCGYFYKGEKQEPKPEGKTGEGLSDKWFEDNMCCPCDKKCESKKNCLNYEEYLKMLSEAKQSIIAEAIKELPKEKVLQNPPDIDDLGDMRFNMCLSEVKQILERIGGLK
jgi:hypothetical protein